MQVDKAFSSQGKVLDKVILSMPPSLYFPLICYIKCLMIFQGEGITKNSK